MVIPIFFKKRFIIHLGGRITDRGKYRVRDRDRDLICWFAAQTPTMANIGLAKTRSLELPLALRSSHCFLRQMSIELDQKHSNQALNSCPYRVLLLQVEA